MKCTATATLQLLFFLTSSGSWNTQKAISSLEPSSDVDTMTAMGKSETSVGRRSSDEDDDDDDASCEWFSGFSVGERDRRSTFADRSRRSCIHLYVLVLWRIGSEFRAYVRTLCAQLAQTCADIMHVARFRDKIYLGNLNHNHVDLGTRTGFMAESRPGTHVRGRVLGRAYQALIQP